MILYVSLEDDNVGSVHGAEPRGLGIASVVQIVRTINAGRKNSTALEFSLAHARCIPPI
jgi:hypothetical protein